MIRCRNGHENPDGSTYCSTCYVMIDATSEPEPPPEPEPEPPSWPEPEEVTAESTAPVALSAVLEPTTSTGRAAGTYTLAVHNAGSAHVAGEPAIATTEGALTFELDPPTLTVAPGASASARLRAIPQRAHWLGGERTHRFRVAVSPEAAVEGTLVQQARVPAWLLVIVAVVAVAAIAAGAVAVISGGDDQIPTNGGVDLNGRVTTAFLNVRSEPNKESEKKDTLKEGTEVKIECKVGNWYRVSFPTEGYMGGAGSLIEYVGDEELEECS